MAICEQAVRLIGHIERAYPAPHYYVGSLYFYLKGVGPWTHEKDVDILLPDPEPFRQQLLEGNKKFVLSDIKIDTPNTIGRYVDIESHCLRFGLVYENLPSTIFMPFMIPISDSLCIPTLNPHLYFLITSICSSRHKDTRPIQAKLSEICRIESDLPQIDRAPFIKFTKEMRNLYPLHYHLQRFLRFYDAKRRYFRQLLPSDHTKNPTPTTLSYPPPHF